MVNTGTFELGTQPLNSCSIGTGPRPCPGQAHALDDPYSAGKISDLDVKTLSRDIGTLSEQDWPLTPSKGSHIC